ncbi:MAG: FAD-binding protein [Clostridia bacterium]|nr:FAD-binding protein [Clostridia bacterium]
MSKIYDAIIIGSGAASYSVADWLYKEKIENVAIITENRLSGTSRNTGSDKQTYYKLSLDGNSLDSPYKMASDICNAGCTDGEKMYLQAVNSIRCFLRLCDYGVDFPQDEFGGYPGYKTDHDNTTRATSVGPLTSKIMTEKLEKRVLENNKTTLLDNRQVVEIITHNNQAMGVIVLNKETERFEIIQAKNVICGTGAPACIYFDSVYPHSQHGMTGIMLDAGVKLCNFTQWQFGLASVDFRWNVSGSFMQVVPRFVSVDENGIEREFLKDYFENPSDFVFLKGYQWPFSYERMEMSSKIDIAVHNETKQGRKVYLDYTQNPSDFDFDSLCDEAREYLLSNNATGDTPIERLAKLNSKAIDVYARQNIDLYTEKLRIAVCAQHNNGGVNTDNNYETDVKNLYAIGECAGTFGLARPGGTALNDTQVSSLLCAKHISSKKQKDDFENLIDQYESKYNSLIEKFHKDETVDYSYISRRMSKSAGFIRVKNECEDLLEEINEILVDLPFSHKSLSSYYYDFDMLLSAKALLKTIIGEMEVTGSRGGAIFIRDGDIVSENKEYRDYLTITDGEKVTFRKVKPVPVVNKPFEQYLKDNV